MTEKMHAGEAEVDVPLVRRLLGDQLPHLAELAIEPVRSTGTVNKIFRLGDDLCVRLPRVGKWADDLMREVEWLPQLAPHLPLAVPEPVALGEPGDGYPFPWAVYRWLEGATFSLDRVRDERDAASDLADFVAELRRCDVSGAPRSGRLPLAQLDAVTRAVIGAAGPAIDTEAATAAWDVCMQAPAWEGTGAVWRHCDLLPDNLLVADGRLRAVIDFGGAGIGDPAADVVPAWSVFAADGRHVFRNALDVDDAVWARARGYALHQALCIIPYYPETNPAFVTMAQRTVQQVLLDLDLGLDPRP